MDKEELTSWQALGIISLILLYVSIWILIKLGRNHVLSHDMTLYTVIGLSAVFFMLIFAALIVHIRKNGFK